VAKNIGGLKKGLHKLMDDQPKIHSSPSSRKLRKSLKHNLPKARQAYQSPILIRLPKLATVRDRILD